MESMREERKGVNSGCFCCNSKRKHNNTIEQVSRRGRLRGGERERRN